MTKEPIQKPLSQIARIHDLRLKKILIGHLRNTKILMPAVVIAIILIQVLYNIDFVTNGLFVYYGYVLDSLSLIQYTILILFYIVTAISLFVISFGVFKKMLWARRYALIFVCWTLIFPLWAILLNYYLLQNIILALADLLIIAYLLYKPVKDYFLQTTDICIYGNCVLYKKIVTLKSGRTLPIYFFSTKKPKSGVPSPLPDGYGIEINANSGMPYLKKLHPTAYHYGPYVLYSKCVRLRNGRRLPIYFFSRHKPKSGQPAARPKGFTVKENPISHMPYLKRRQKKTKQ